MNVTPEDRRQLEAIVGDRNAPQKPGSSNALDGPNVGEGGRCELLRSVQRILEAHQLVMRAAIGPSVRQWVGMRRQALSAPLHLKSKICHAPPRPWRI